MCHQKGVTGATFNSGGGECTPTCFIFFYKDIPRPFGGLRYYSYLCIHEDHLKYPHQNYDHPIS
jgi:hypothetical protein